MAQAAARAADECAVHTNSWRAFASVYLPRMLPCFFGLVAVRVWIQCCVYDRYLATDFGAYSTTANLLRVLLIAALVLYARRGLSSRARTVLDWFSVTAMTLSAVMLLLQVERPEWALAPEAVVLGALGLVWGGGMWIRFFARLDAGEALVYAFACLALSSLAGLAVGFMPPMAAYALAVLMPTLSIVSYWAAMRALDARAGVISEPRTDAVYDGESKAAIIRLLAGVALLEFALGVARGFPFGDSIALGAAQQVANQVGVALLSLGVVWWVLVRGGGLRFSSLWRIEVALMIAGVVALSSLEPALMSWGAVAVTIANTFKLGILWYCAYDFAKHSSWPAYVVLGVVWIVHMLPREVGRWAIWLWGPTSQGAVEAVGLMVCLLALSLAFVLRDTSFRTRPFFAAFRSAGYRERVAASLRGEAGAFDASAGTEGMRASRAAAAMGTGAAAGKAEAAAGAEMAAEPVAGAAGTAAAVASAAAAAAPAAEAGAAARAPLGDAASVVDGQLGQGPSERSALASLDERCRRLAQRYALTEREADMVRLIAQGRSKRFIAQQLFISENTVKGYTRNVYQKLGIHSKQALIDRLNDEADAS
ncbi:LuxR family transcriptional regulator [Eggerthellaceae bacterium zg-997]|nr:LuxR family transcriptional regulator [Eggerthellaceae bacterium zg-997]